jgi:hypothetical protein
MLNRIQEDYLRIEESLEIPCEYYDGLIVAKVGGTT